jgi:phosphinothricin acetyltransferase
MEIDDADETDLPDLVDILNQAVRETTASWSYVEVDLAERRAWLADKAAKGLPVLVAREADGQVAGYASYGPFRPWSGYLHTVENSVYVRPDRHRRGIGRALMAALIARAGAAGLHVMVAAIEAGNAPSIRLHQEFGFRETARMPQVGAKFGRWLDLVLMQLVLDVAARPPQ